MSRRYTSTPEEQAKALENKFKNTNYISLLTLVLPSTIEGIYKLITFSTRNARVEQGNDNSRIPDTTFVNSIILDDELKKKSVEIQAQDTIVEGKTPEGARALAISRATNKKFATSSTFEKIAQSLKLDIKYTPGEFNPDT